MNGKQKKNIMKEEEEYIWAYIGLTLPLKERTTTHSNGETPSLTADSEADSNYPKLIIQHELM